MTQLSPHFSLEELTVSQTAARHGLDNTPPAEILARMRDILCPGLEEVRDLLGYPIHVNSGFRSQAVNAAVGGVGKSAHTLGYAADFICPAFGSPIKVCEVIAASHIRFDQLIFEAGVWTHISFDPQMRMERLSMHGGHYTSGFA